MFIYNKVVRFGRFGVNVSDCMGCVMENFIYSMRFIVFCSGSVVMGDWFSCFW